MAGESTGASGSEASPSLRKRVEALVQSWAELQAGTWNATAAADQYEELERISSAAEADALREVAGSAVEAAVYLCTFVEGRLYPSNAQRAKLNEMIERLSAAADGGPRRSALPPNAASDRRVVMYLRAAGTELPGLSEQLGRRRYVVMPCEDAAQATALAEQAAPDVLLVDSGSIAPLAEVIEAAERARGDAKGRAGCVVVGAQIEHARRLFAQRAGADMVIDGPDAVDIVTRIDELLALQRNLDYRVLIVEDDRSQAVFCESVLKLRGIATRTCAAGEEALEVLAQFKPDLVLMDLYLPGINGIEVAQRIRERPEHAFLPIVFLSGETDLDKRFDAIRMGGDDFITKPVKPRHLLTEVETRVRRARQLPARGEGSPRAERRGALVSRAAFMDELLRVASAPAGESVALVLVAVVGEQALSERLGLIGSGVISQQFGAALCSEVELLRAVCALGEMSFLGLMSAEAEPALRSSLTLLRERLLQRGWSTGSELPKLEIGVAGLRLAPGGDSGDTAIRKLHALAREVMVGSGVAYEPGRAGLAGEDPVHRLARTLLRGPVIPEAIRIEYQAQVPLTGNIAGQYAARFALVAPRASTRMEVPPERLRDLARELGVVPAADRQCLRRALSVLGERVQRGDEMSLFLPISAESGLDPAFAPWLATELQARALAPASIVLELVASELLREPARIGALLDSLQPVGARLCIGGLEGGEAHVRLLRHPSVAMVRLAAPSGGDGATTGTWGAERGRLIVEAAKRGRQVFAQGPREAHEVGELLKLGVQYIASDVFSPWSTEANFDFAGGLM
jgi:DNA-binding response OmpR family regulator/EAL domain-containing protein (putative c-di-GMP-specific phosphodiesterase class I)